jgi:hypothetical protein
VWLFCSGDFSRQAATIMECWANKVAATFKNPKVVFLFLKTKCVNGLIVKELND